MSLEEDILIEKFINGTLVQQELAAFLKRMDDDADFKKKVLLEEELSASLNIQDWNFINDGSLEAKEYQEIYRSDDIKQLKNVIQNVNSNYQEANKKISNKWILYASAAVIALFISIAVFYPNQDPQDLYTQYIAETNLPSFISREDSNENMLIRAQQLFENKEYEKALIIFNDELKITNSADGALYLYIGISQMELEAYAEAEKTFNTLISSNLIDAEKGKWFKSLLFLKMGQIEQSKSQLNEIIQNSTYNYQKAKKLLKKLD